jgi:4-amino-4-deoxy-L-arabinose transferase-like glycosyltransferase
MIDELNLPFGLVLLITFSAGGIAALHLTRNHRDTLPFQVKLFISAYLVRFAASIAVYIFGLVNVLGDEDASGWYLGVYHKQDWERLGAGLLDLPAALSGAFEGHHQGYGYLLGALFYLTDSPGRMPAAALNCFLGALTVVFVYKTARSLFSEWVAVRAGWITCFFPSMIIWSAQTLKEPVIILLEAVALYSCVRLKVSRFSFKHILLCAVAIVLMIPFRFYAAYVAGAAVALTLILPNLKKGKLSVGSAVGLAAVIIPVIFMSGVLARHEAEFEKFNLARAQKFSRDVSYGEGGGSGVQTGYDLRTSEGLSMAIAVGGAHLLLAPFPWQIGGASLRMLMTTPELVVWWWLFFFGVLPGMWYAIRNRLNDIQPMLFFIFGLGMLYSMMFGNLGLVFRQRAQILPWLLILAVVGLERRLVKRLESQNQFKQQATDIVPGLDRRIAPGSLSPRG